MTTTPETPEQIVAEAFTAAREPEYKIAEPQDAEDAAIAVAALRTAGLLGGDPQEPSAHATPLAVSGERVRNQTDSSHVAPQEPSEWDCSCTCSHLHHSECHEQCVPAPCSGREELIAEAGAHVESNRCGNPMHTNLSVSCPDCEAACEWCDNDWPCLTSRLRDALAAQPVLDPEDDERVIAWERIAKHPALRPCYSEERPLLHSVLDRLTNMLELEQAVGELAPAPDIVLDPEKVAELIDREFDDYRPVYSEEGKCIDSNAARALCEAARRGELT